MSYSTKLQFANSVRRYALATASVTALLTSAPMALADDAAAKDPELEEVVVTGSRVVRDGHVRPCVVCCSPFNRSNWRGQGRAKFKR